MSQWVQLRDIGKIVTGNTPTKSDLNNYKSKDIHFIKPSDLSDSHVIDIVDSEYFISQQAYCKARIAPKGAVLVTCIGVIGKVGILQKECAFNQQINAIIPDYEKVDSNYLAYAIESRKSFLQKKANTAVVPIINKNQFSEITIPLPGINTQKDIAHVLNKIDWIIKLRKKSLITLDKLIKSRYLGVMAI